MDVFTTIVGPTGQRHWNQIFSCFHLNAGTRWIGNDFQQLSTAAPRGFQAFGCRLSACLPGCLCVCLSACLPVCLLHKLAR